MHIGPLFSKLSLCLNIVPLWAPSPRGLLPATATATSHTTSAATPLMTAADGTLYTTPAATASTTTVMTPAASTAATAHNTQKSSSSFWGRLSHRGLRSGFVFHRGFYQPHTHNIRAIYSPPSIARPSWASHVPNFLHGSMSCSRSTIPGSSNAGPMWPTAKSSTPSIVHPSVSIGFSQHFSQDLSTDVSLGSQWMCQ
jgi:hypothetical protein